MKKNGFTLIELLAIIALLGIILAVIVSNVKDMYEESKKNIGYENANRIVKSLQEYYVRMKIKGDFDGCSIDFNDLNSCSDYSFNGSNPVEGFIQLSSDGSILGYVQYDKYTFDIADDFIGEVNNSLIGTEYVYDYTGDEQVFTSEYFGYYKLEVWGAQGGSSSGYSGKGGYGGYSTGNIFLEKGATLYINVGGTGGSGLSAGGVGGYNGGGSGGRASSSSYSGGAGGGGATHIAYKSGLLSSLSGDIDKILIVAGGGGGSCANLSGGSGGGISGENGNSVSSSFISIGATQSDGYQFGLGANGRSSSSFSSNGAEGNGGSGGGYYGGFAPTATGGSTDAAGSGGSGYLSDSLISGVMYCYNCVSAQEESNINILTTSFSSDSISLNAKSGNGYVKITYLGMRKS